MSAPRFYAFQETDEEENMERTDAPSWRVRWSPAEFRVFRPRAFSTPPEPLCDDKAKLPQPVDYWTLRCGICFKPLEYIDFSLSRALCGCHDGPSL